MNKNEFQPIDLKKVREQVEKERIEKKEDQEQKSVFVEERELLGMPFYFYSHYDAPFFLEDVKEISINTLDNIEGIDPSDLSGEEWKKQELTEKVQVAIEQKINESKEVPLKISFSWKTRDLLQEFNLIPKKLDYSTSIFYLPEGYKNDVEKFNNHALAKMKKQGQERLARMISDINPN